ncbi:hypothetical protein ABKN59_007735 [Abortiporus biennis]
MVISIELTMSHMLCPPLLPTRPNIHPTHHQTFGLTFRLVSRDFCCTMCFCTPQCPRLYRGHWLQYWSGSSLQFAFSTPNLCGASFTKLGWRSSGHLRLP